MKKISGVLQLFLILVVTHSFGAVTFYFDDNCQGFSFECQHTQVCVDSSIPNLKKVIWTQPRYEKLLENGHNGEAPVRQTGTEKIRANDRIRSVRVTNSERVWLNEDTDFGGDVLVLEGNECFDLSEFGFENRVSSLEIDAR